MCTYLYSDEFVQSSMMPEEKRQLLLKVFSLLKQKIIWKVGGLSHPNMIEYVDQMLITSQ